MRLLIGTTTLMALIGFCKAQVAVQSGMTADSYCGDGYCVTGLYSPQTKLINYTMVVPQGGAQLGWYAFAQGQQMTGANMAINWVNSDLSLTTSHRSAKGEFLPLTSYVTVQEFSANTEVSKSKTGQTIWSWNMPLPSSDPQNAVQHVFAMSSTSPTSSSTSATIVKHNRYDQGIALDLTKAYTGSAPAGIAGSTQATTTSNTGGQRDLSKNTTRIFLVHMIFMILGWQLLIPIGVLLARYGRTFFTWFPYHRIVMLAGFLFIFIAFFLAVSGVGLQSKDHFSNTHEKLGLSLFILIVVQVLLGASSHELKKRKGLRYIGFVHIPFGLILYALSVWNIHEGFSVWQWDPPAYASYIIYAWAGLMGVLYIVGLAFLPKELKQNKQDQQNALTKHELSSDEDQRIA